MRFIHIADVHLGAVPDSGCPWSVSREKEIWKTFQKVIEGIQKEKIDLLLIAGDLFHRQPLARELREVNYLFSSIPDTEVVWMAGNHDYLKENSAYKKITWAENVHGFFKQEMEEIYLPSIHTWVYGLSYTQKEICDNLYQGVTPNGKSGHHILLAHGGDEKHIPFQKSDMEGFDYVALGHIHKPEILIENYMAYAGALEPLERNDMGVHGLILGEINDSPKTRIQFVPFACRSYENLDLTIHSGTTQLSLERKVQDGILQKGKQNIYRVRLKGYRNPDMEFDGKRLSQTGNIVEIQDDTRPCYNMEKIRKEYAGTLIEDYIQCFDGKTGTVDQKALYYGIQALMEKEL